LTSAALTVKLPNPLTLHESKEARPRFERAGAWLFRRRTSIPVPLALALLFIPAPEPPSTTVRWLGVALVACGEGLRLWAVRHIGVISRTRSDRLGPLVETGPFALIRNPLYVGNLALWVGFTLSARLVPLVPLVISEADHRRKRMRRTLATATAINYLDRQMLSTMKPSMMLDIPELAKAESFGLFMA
jgi:hypothetical protein